jgi:hypothetical protein
LEKDTIPLEIAAVRAWPWLPCPALLRRCVWLAFLGVSGALTGILLYLVVGMIPSIPRGAQRSIASLVVRIRVLACIGMPTAVVAMALPRRIRGRLGAVAAGASKGPLTVAVASACLLLLLAWVPHYLTWPWFADTDQFAVSAQSWDAGLVPYRDLPDIDFPGPIYECYLLGKTFGWGRTAPFYALDAGLVVVLGLALAGWSRRLFGSALPGLVGGLVFLCYYLSLSYINVAQRDWHGPLFAVLALLALEAWPHRAGRLASATAMAVALAYRPQVMLFLPALAAAVDEGGRRPFEPWSRAARPLWEWCAGLTAALFVAFAPLILPGALDDFLRCLRFARYGGSYNHTTWQSLFRGVHSELCDPLTFLVFGALVLLSFAGPEVLRRPARTWWLALFGALLYKPISPVQHAYLDQPLYLIRSIALAVPAAWLLATHRPFAPLRLAGVVAVLVVFIPQFPRYCSVARSLDAFGSLADREVPSDPPLGCARNFPGTGQPVGHCHYRWQDYRRLLAYLREAVPPRTRVANFLRSHPFPTVNGPTGHLNTFPAAGGLLHLGWVDPGMEARYVAALEHTVDSVVVWNPGESRVDPRLRLPRLVQAIRRWYRPEARFGSLEVWRHESSCLRRPADRKGVTQNVSRP